MQEAKPVRGAVKSRVRAPRPAESADHPKLRRTVTQERARQRVDAILQATEQAIVANGGDRLSMVDIAARAGITHTSIYHYFKSVDEILKLLVWRIASDHFEATKAIVEEANTVEGLIDTYAATIRLGWDKYRNTPTARGLFANVRHLTTLRRVDDDYNDRRAEVVWARFREVAPHADQRAIRAAIELAQSLTLPAFEFAMTRSKRDQSAIVDEFIAMIRSRLMTLVGRGAGDAAGPRLKP